MVEGQAQRDDVAQGNGFSDGYRLAQNTPHAEDRAFGIVDDWCEGIDTERTEAGDREGAPVEFVCLQSFRVGPFDQITGSQRHFV